MNRITNYHPENEDVIVSRVILAVQEQIDHVYIEKSKTHSKRLAKTIVTLPDELTPEFSNDLDNSPNAGPPSRSLNKSDKLIEQVSSARNSGIDKVNRQSGSADFSSSTLQTPAFSPGVQYKIIIGLIMILAILILVGLAFLTD
jgi:hypothetical protein